MKKKFKIKSPYPLKQEGQIQNVDQLFADIETNQQGGSIMTSQRSTLFCFFRIG